MATRGITPSKTPAKRKFSNSNVKLNKSDDENLKGTVDELVKNVEMTRSKIFQQKLELQQTKQQIEAVQAKREETKKKAANYHHMLHEKRVAVAEAREKTKLIVEKVAVFKKRAEKVEELKEKMQQRVKDSAAAVEQKVIEHRALTQRAKKSTEDTVEMLVTVQTNLEESKQKHLDMEHDLATWQREKQAEVAERRREWNDVQHAFDVACRGKDDLCRDIEKTRKQLHDMQHQIQVNDNQVVENKEQLEHLEKKAEFESQVQCTIDEIVVTRSENESLARELDRVRIDLRSKIIEKRIQREKEERELEREIRELADIEEKRKAERMIHQEKLNQLNDNAVEREKTLATAEQELQTQRSAQKSEWEKLEAQKQTTLALQQQSLEDLKKEVEAMAGKAISTDGFSADCQAIQDLKSKMKEEKERILLEIDTLKREAKEEIETHEKELAVERKLAKEKELAKSLAPAKVTASFLFDLFPEKPVDPRQRKVDSRHVTFKNTPVVWESVSSQGSSVSNGAASQNVPPRINKAIPTTKTPSPKKAASSAAATVKPPFPKSATASSSQFSDSSDGLSFEMPPTQPVVRKPTTVGKNKKPFPPDFLGIF